MVRFLSRVNLLVLFQFVRVSETLPTDSAGKGVLRVSVLDMLLKVLFPSEIDVTVRAGVRLTFLIHIPFGLGCLLILRLTDAPPSAVERVFSWVNLLVICKGV